ncbi:hypothetical protein [Streptomyces griseorubiginosus]|uniref:hypothetical protein n=1 Tax=Streptomyces griseorubiginosus TaxID=67304 RepID=UPI002E80E03D|nr:hypothetical protein [Streptomyces griseorubiginosus]WUB43910.1 hypothetical protein OHN19_11410 [Streptomyces griseorubiginosus]WUB52428.1 hypothetical protein OG942_11405 [Streptomyces griseorubiginosus]
MIAVLSRAPRRTRNLIAVAVALLAVAGCSSSDKQTNDESKPVCGGKLDGEAFQTLVGDDGVTEEDVDKFSPTKWNAAGSCSLYGKKHAVVVDYLFHSDTIDNLDRYRSPGPSTVKTFKVGSATGYLETTKVRVAKGNVNQNRAWLALPCAIPGEKTSDHAMLEIEVKEPPPARTLDDSLTNAFVSALTIATSYLGDDVFKCSAAPSATPSGPASPGPSGG